MRVLLVDDDTLFGEQCCRWLFERNHDVMYVTNVEQAQTLLLADSAFDLALIDLMLPLGAEGVALLQYVRRRHKSIEPVLITRKQEDTVDIVAEAMRQGARHFLDKNNVLFFDELDLVLREIMRAAKANVFLSHGHNELLKLKLKDFLQSRLGRAPIILSEQPNLGATVVEKLERVSQACSFAIVLMTKDDELKDGGVRARQNVVHEIGFFQGRYGRNNVVFLAERGVQVFSNITGIIRIDFEPEHFEEVFEPLRLELDAVGLEAR